jgi:hypothetical protein
MYKNLQILRENPETANAGKKWSEEEINELLNERKEDKSIEDIAKIHKRTYSSVKSKLLAIAVSLLNKMSIEESSNIVKFSVPTIKQYMEKYPKEKPEKPEKPEKNINIIDTLGISTLKIEEPVIIKPEIVLNYEQQSALKHFKLGKNIFLTGPAGTGKSVTLNKIKEYCVENKFKFGITASTGTAAFLLGGKTLHSFLGIGLASESAEDLFKNVRYKLPQIASKLRELKVLIIDEISMIDAALLDKISEYLQWMRKIYNPFGGIQVVLTGDFCQLEPVNGEYCFKSKVWEPLNLKIVYLTKLIRQDGDCKFQNILSKLRYGKCSQKTFELLSSLSKTKFGEIKPTILYPRNFDVDKINKMESEKLIKSGAKNETYKIELPFSAKSKEKTERWIKSLDIPDSVLLCVGDQVVVTVNIDQDNGIVNGTRGVVIDVRYKNVIIKNIDGKLLEIKYHKSINVEDSNVHVSYIPLKLAYALSIHKSQGMTLDAIEIDIGSKIFAAGQAYTALSRAKNLNSVKVKSISKTSFIINNDVLEFYKKIEKEIKIKEDKFINKHLNTIIYNIANHINLDNSLDLIWDLIPADEIEILEFFDGYKKPKITLELMDYENMLELNDIVKYVYKTKPFIDIDNFRYKLKDFI